MLEPLSRWVFTSGPLDRMVVYWAPLSALYAFLLAAWGTRRPAPALFWWVLPLPFPGAAAIASWKMRQDYAHAISLAEVAGRDLPSYGALTSEACLNGAWVAALSTSLVAALMAVGAAGSARLAGRVRYGGVRWVPLVAGLAIVVAVPTVHPLLKLMGLVVVAMAVLGRVDGDERDVDTAAALGTLAVVLVGLAGLLQGRAWMYRGLILGDTMLDADSVTTYAWAAGRWFAGVGLLGLVPLLVRAPALAPMPVVLAGVVGGAVALSWPSRVLQVVTPPADLLDAEVELQLSDVSLPIAGRRMGGCVVALEGDEWTAQTVGWTSESHQIHPCPSPGQTRGFGDLEFRPLVVVPSGLSAREFADRGWFAGSSVLHLAARVPGTARWPGDLQPWAISWMELGVGEPLRSSDRVDRIEEHPSGAKITNQRGTFVVPLHDDAPWQEALGSVGRTDAVFVPGSGWTMGDVLQACERARRVRNGTVRCIIR